MLLAKKNIVNTKNDVIFFEQLSANNYTVYTVYVFNGNKKGIKALEKNFNTYEQAEKYYNELKQEYNTCPICMYPAHDPYRRYNKQGNIIEGCVHNFHDNYLPKPSNTWQWVLNFRKIQKIKFKAGN